MVAETWTDSEETQLDLCSPDHPDWWTVFDDPALNRLIRTAYEQNLSLREAGWRVMQARSRRTIAAGNLFPQTQQGFAGFERIQESTSVAVPPPLRAFDDWSAGLNLAWELDVWGRFRRSITAADASLEASVGDYDAVLIGLIAEVASAYADYRTFQQRLKYARHNVEIQEGSLKLTQEKADAGKTGYASVHLAKSSLQSTRAVIPSLEIGLRQAGNRLCTLLGVPAHDLTDMLGDGNIPIAPPEIAIGIPADLLRRRPDIRSAERAVAAQSEQIGIALADLYPHFSIKGEIAFEAEDFANLFKSASNAGSIGPSFRWDLLNYGRITNNVRLQQAGLKELIASYRNTVLTANQEAEDALVAFLRNQERVRLLKDTVKETEEARRLLTLSFEEGDISFSGVFVIQGVLASLEDQLAQARGDVATSLITLYKALGGGWEIRCTGFPPHRAGLQPPESGEAVPVQEEMDPVPPPAEVISQPPGIMETVPLPEAMPMFEDPNVDAEPIAPAPPAPNADP
jgi:NodT family efflux transporter outer membrane factor (OMF) lipoprotein